MHMPKIQTPKLNRLTVSTFNRTAKAIRAKFEKSNLTPRQWMESLSLDELAVTIAIMTVNFGRDLDGAKKNALNHIQDRENAIRLFTIKDAEKDLGMVLA